MYNDEQENQSNLNWMVATAWRNAFLNYWVHYLKGFEIKQYVLYLERIPITSASCIMHITMFVELAGTY